MDDQRKAAEQVFRDRMAPFLALGEEHQDATEIFIDGDEIRLSWGDRKQRIEWDDPRMRGASIRSVQAAANAAAVFAGVEFGPMPPALPLISVKIPPDLRVTYVMPPAAEKWHVAIRFLRSRRFTLEDYVTQGVMTAEQAVEVRSLLVERHNLIISGGTGSGKTTLLRALIAEIADTDRLVVLEDTPELSISGENVTHLHTTLNVDLAMLLRTTLRLTPDRIVVGEVRGPEALELVRAMNTGHDGTLTTLHSNGAQEALGRLHTLVAEAQPSFPFEGVRSAVDAVVQINGKGKDRRVTDIWRVPR